MRQDPEPIERDEEESQIDEDREDIARDFLWDEGDPADRRKDPLRTPGS